MEQKNDDHKYIYRRFDTNIQLETIQIYKVNFDKRTFDDITLTACGI